MTNRRGFISLYVLAAVAVICLVCLAIIARNWSCREPRERRWQNRQHRTSTIGPYDVVSVDGPTTLTVKQSRRRERAVQLQYIEVSGSSSPAARDQLKRLAGTAVTVQYNRGLAEAIEGYAAGWLSESDAEAAYWNAMDEETLDWWEGKFQSRPPIRGVVFGSSGTNCNLALIEAGLAKCQLDAPGEWKTAEAKLKNQNNPIVVVSKMDTIKKLWWLAFPIGYGVIGLVLGVWLAWHDRVRPILGGLLWPIRILKMLLGGE